MKIDRIEIEKSIGLVYNKGRNGKDIVYIVTVQPRSAHLLR